MVIYLENKTLLTFKLFYKIKNRNSILYVLFFAIIMLSIIFAVKYKTPQSFTDNIGIISVIIIPVISILVFYDYITYLYETNELKRLIIEPLTNFNFYMALILNASFISFIIMVLIIMPEFSAMYFLHYLYFNSVIKFLIFGFYIFLYTLLFSLFSIIFTVVSKRSYISLTMPVMLFLFIIYGYPFILNGINNYIIYPLYGINSNSVNAEYISNLEFYFSPVGTVPTIQNMLYNKYYINFSFKYGIFCNIVKSNFIHSVNISLFFMIPTVIYIIIFSILILFALRYLHKKY